MHYPSVGQGQATVNPNHTSVSGHCQGCGRSRREPRGAMPNAMPNTMPSAMHNVMPGAMRACVAPRFPWLP